MTIYETIKGAISVNQAAEHYGLKVSRNGMAWNRLDLRFFRCILHRLRRNADWMWERILICLCQRTRDSHNVHRRRKKQSCRRLSILELYNCG